MITAMAIAEALPVPGVATVSSAYPIPPTLGLTSNSPYGAGKLPATKCPKRPVEGKIPRLIREARHRRRRLPQRDLEAVSDQNGATGLHWLKRGSSTGTPTSCTTWTAPSSRVT